MQAALRTFFRFCHAQAYTPHRLDEAVPSLRAYTLATVPKALTDEQARSVLANMFPPSSDAERRDYALLQLLYTYGVRGGQIGRLQLDDIHWATDEILFRAMKGGKDVLMPLARPVGEAILDYLSNSRPQVALKEVFLTSRAPYRPLMASNAISAIVRRRLTQAGIQLESMGSCAFRHCFASRMLRHGQSIKSIADLLGHRDIRTTFIYTKVDFQRLRAVALDWPEEQI